jgi:hypothetical protein
MTMLDTPAGINMWVMLSRRHQVQMHLKGLKVKGIMAALRRDFGDHGNRVANYIVPIESEIGMAGGIVDYNLVNVHVMQRVDDSLFMDCGIFANMNEVEAFPGLVEAYSLGQLEIVYTLDEPRQPNGKAYQPA